MQNLRNTSLYQPNYPTDWLTDLLVGWTADSVTYGLTPWSGVLLEKLTVPQLSKQVPAFDRTQGPPLHTQKPAISTYPKSHKSSPCPPSMSSRSTWILSYRPPITKIHLHTCLYVCITRSTKTKSPVACGQTHFWNSNNNINTYLVLLVVALNSSGHWTFWKLSWSQDARSTHL